MRTAGTTSAQDGRVAVVTGANSGLGFEVAKILALRGATVVLACRDTEKAEHAAAEIGAAGVHVRSRLGVIELDLGSVTAVRGAAAEIRSRYSRLDLLVNNAGVMYVVPFQTSDDGIELTFATNHLGHFALTGLLIDRLLAGDSSRIVTVSSLAHKRGVPRFEEARSPDGYKPGPAYDQSKLANLMFTLELQRRLRAAGASTIAVAAHPGIVYTPLWRTSSSLERALIGPRLRMLNFWLAQGAQAGAQPILRAALDPEVRGGEYYGPGGWSEYTGAPVRVLPSQASHDAAGARQLWTLSEQLTDVRYPLPETPTPPGPR